ncbi:unnamed protein product [Amoebophrya sp. A120]|nr:unnamed protein product [Amoebophrya sp. A120]|eukprot:GSA120T00005866001.1
MQKTIHDPGDVVVWDKAYPRQDKKISPESEDKEKSKGEIITGRKSKTGCNHNDDRGRDDEHAEEEELPRREATSAGGAKFDEEKDNKNATNDPAKAPTLTQLKHELACGRLGEQILEQKVAGADAFAILIGFLLAFVVEKLLSLNPSDFQNHLWFKVYTSMLGIASACGFSCVLALTFLGAKIRRLSGRSLYLFGSSDEDVDALAAAVGEPEITKRVLSVRKANAQTSGTSERSTQGKLALHARTWYYANAKVSTKWKWYSDVTKNTFLLRPPFLLLPSAQTLRERVPAVSNHADLLSRGDMREAN